MAKNKIVFEKDEKKSILIAVIISIIVVLAVVLAFIAIRNQKKDQNNKPNEVITTEDTQTSETVKSDAVVKNQEELNRALHDSNITAIVFQSKENQTVVIPSGDYSRIAFVVDAPYTEITNYGKFGSITIRQISSNTWTESVSGNSIKVDAPASHFVIPNGIEVSSMDCIQAKSTVAIELQGVLRSLNIGAASSIVSVQVDGELTEMQIGNKTNLKILGGSKKMINIELANNAGGSLISSTVPTLINAYAQVNVELLKGAEGSQFFVMNEASEMTIMNNTSDIIAVMESSEEQKSVSSGKSYTHKAKTSASTPQTGNTNTNNTNTNTNTSTENKNNQSNKNTNTTTSVIGGYSQSQVDKIVNDAVANATAQLKEQFDQIMQGMISKDEVGELINQAVSDALKDAEIEKDQAIKDAVEDAVEDAVQDAIQEVLNKPVIVGFAEEPHIYAGVQGELPKLEEIVFPMEVSGLDTKGEIHILKVKEWVNTDQYNEDVTAGNYYFTAVIEESQDVYIAENTAAYAVVTVKPTSRDSAITYKEAGYSQQIRVTEYKAADYDNVPLFSPEAYYVIENYSENAVIYTALNYYYYDSEGNLLHRERWNGIYIQPGSSWIAYRTKLCLDYAYYVVEVDNFTNKNPKVDSMLNVQIEENNLLVHKTVEEDVSEATIMILYLGEDGVSAYGVQSLSTKDINNTTSINDTSETVNMVFNLNIPLGADLSKSIIVWKGGYQ